MTEAIQQLNKEKTIFWTLSAILILSLGFYTYFINMTVRNIAVRQNLEEKSTQLLTSNSALEFKYISARNNITLPLAYSLGFKDISSKSFVSTQNLNSLSYLNR